MKVIDTIWFSDLDGPVGIVIVEDFVTQQRRAYIGRAGGLSHDADAQRILASGSRFHFATAMQIAHALANPEK